MSDFWSYISSIRFQVLGTPTREQIREMNPNYTEFKFPQIKAHPWTKVSWCLRGSLSHFLQSQRLRGILCNCILDWLFLLCTHCISWRNFLCGLWNFGRAKIRHRLKTRSCPHCLFKSDTLVSYTCTSINPDTISAQRNTLKLLEVALQRFTTEWFGFYSKTSFFGCPTPLC